MNFCSQKYVLWLLLVLLSGCSPFSVNIGAGGTYVLDVPETRITGHEQFYFKLEVEKPVTDNLSVITGWNHISNGAQLGIGRYPNYGIDLFNAHVEYRFQF